MGLNICRHETGEAIELSFSLSRLDDLKYVGIISVSCGARKQTNPQLIQSSLGLCRVQVSGPSVDATICGFKFLI